MQSKDIKLDTCIFNSVKTQINGAIPQKKLALNPELLYANFCASFQSFYFWQKYGEIALWGMCSGGIYLNLNVLGGMFFCENYLEYI